MGVGEIQSCVHFPAFGNSWWQWCVLECHLVVLRDKIQNWANVGHMCSWLWQPPVQRASFSFVGGGTVCWGRDRIGLTADFRLGGEAKTLKLHLHWSLLQPWLRLFLQAQPELCHQVSAYLMWNSSIWHFWNFWLRPDGKIIRQETHGFKQASFASLVQDTVLRFQTHCNWPTCLQPGPLRIYPPHCCLSIF